MTGVAERAAAWHAARMADPLPASRCFHCQNRRGLACTASPMPAHAAQLKAGIAVAVCYGFVGTFGQVVATDATVTPSAGGGR